MWYIEGRRSPSIAIPVKKEKCCGGEFINNTHVHIHKEKKSRPVKIRKPNIVYKRNYERALDNNGFHHPENTDSNFIPFIRGADSDIAELFM